MVSAIAIPRRLVDKVLRKMTPLVLETVELFKENADDDGLTPRLKEWIERHKVERWAEAYEDFNGFLAAHLAALPALGISADTITSPAHMETREDAQRWVDSIWALCEKVLDDDSEVWLDEIIEGQPQPHSESAMDDEEKPVSRQALFLTAALIICHNYFACMVHRKSLFQLVAEAKRGEDESLLKAIQTDKRCLVDIFYFRERLHQSVVAGEDKFVQRILLYQKKPSAAINALVNCFLIVSMGYPIANCLFMEIFLAAALKLTRGSECII